MVVPVGHRTATVFGQVFHSGAPEEKFAIFDCLVAAAINIKICVLKVHFAHTELDTLTCDLT